MARAKNPLTGVMEQGATAPVKPIKPLTPEQLAALQGQTPDPLALYRTSAAKSAWGLGPSSAPDLQSNLARNSVFDLNTAINAGLTAPRKTTPADDILAGAPPPPPDLADEGLANTRKAQLLRLLSGRGRRSTFLTGPLGSTGAASKPTLLGA